MSEHVSTNRILTDAEIAAVAVGWKLAHDAACRGAICSAHQPADAPAQRPRVVEALLSDWRFMALKDRADWNATTAAPPTPNPLPAASVAASEENRDG